MGVRFATMAIARESVLRAIARGRRTYEELLDDLEAARAVSGPAQLDLVLAAMEREGSVRTRRMRQRPTGPMVLGYFAGEGVPSDARDEPGEGGGG